MDHTSSVAPISSVAALDAAFSGMPCDLVRADGRTKRLAAHRWTGPATAEEIDLFVEPCTGSALDVGCGPGRLTVALTRKGLAALGLDISAEAVRLTRRRGGDALQHDVFQPLPVARRWRHVLLADGNIGLGGDPVRLLEHLHHLLEAGGTMLVELAGPGVLGHREQVRLRVAGMATEPFHWATVGIDDIERVAGLAGLAVLGVRSVAGRHVATLVPSRGDTEA